VETNTEAKKTPRIFVKREKLITALCENAAELQGKTLVEAARFMTKKMGHPVTRTNINNASPFLPTHIQFTYEPRKPTLGEEDVAASFELAPPPSQPEREEIGLLRKAIAALESAVKTIAPSYN
jgi:hypothetical protein